MFIIPIVDSFSSLFIASFLKPMTWALYTGSVLVGFGAASKYKVTLMQGTHKALLPDRSRRVVTARCVI